MVQAFNDQNKFMIQQGGKILQQTFEQKLEQNEAYSNDFLLNSEKIESQINESQKYNRRYQKSISNGQYEKLVKEKNLSRAQQQKQQLEKKLQYINKSINSIKEYNYLAASKRQIQRMSKQISFEDREELHHQSLQKIHEIKSYIKSIKKKKKQLKAKFELKKKQEQEMSQKIASEQKLRHKQQIYDKMKKIKQRMENREILILQQNNKLKEVKKRKELFQKIQENYIERQNSFLQERKKKLAEIRNIHKPIDLSQLQTHQQNFLKTKEERDNIRIRSKKMSENSEPQYKVSYKSSFYLRQSRLQKQDQNDQSKEKVEKMNKFLMHVRQNFSPSIDEEKKREIEEIIEGDQCKKKSEQQKPEESRRKAEAIRNIGLKYLQEVKQVVKRYPVKKRQDPPQTERTTYQNYLTHKQRRSSGNWDNILQSNDSKREKAMKMHYESQKFQTSLKMKEQKAKLLRSYNQEDLDQEYFEMIKAKLDLLHG